MSDYIKRLFQDRYAKTYLGLAVLCVAILIAMFIQNPRFLSLDNILNMAYQMSMIAIMAFGVNAVVISKGTDLSSGAVLGLSGMVGVIAYTKGLPPVLSLLLMILVGIIVGALNGILVSYLEISPFIATYGVMAFSRGLLISISGSAAVAADSDIICWLGGESIFGVPVAIFAIAAAFLIWWFVLNRTLLGKYLYAVGGNFEASRASGINAKRVRLIAYMMAGASAGLAGIIFVGRVRSAQPLAGFGMEFEVLTAVFIGGALISGGSGRVGGALFGAFLMTLIRTALSFLAASQYITYILTGSMVLFSVMIHQSGMWEELKTFAILLFDDFRDCFQGGDKQKTGQQDLKKEDHVLELKGISKSFSGFQALSGVDAVIKSGEIIALVGENGAGKSTLVNVLSGVFRESAGEIFLDGKKVTFLSPQDSKNVGIGVIHQHYSLIPELTVAQNLFYNQEPGKFGCIRVGEMNRRAKEYLTQFGLDIPVKTKAYKLTVGQSQLIEIIKATINNPWLLIMDEPTSSLAKVESERVYELMRKIQEKNIAIIFISHKLKEVFQLCDSALVLRDGQLVGTVDDVSKYTEAELVKMMVGRELTDIFPYTEAEKGEILFELQNITDGDIVKDVSMYMRAGEVVGLAGLMGAGRTETIECVYGLRRKKGGTIKINGKIVDNLKNTDMLRLGVGLVPEDRHKSGIVQQSSVLDNLTLIWNRLNNKAGILKIKEIRSKVAEVIEEVGLRPPNPWLETMYLSGGNQQKVVIGKWMMISPQILLLDDPTRGIDVGAKKEIHGIIADYKKSGCAILMISSELPELLNVADRIYVMHNGKIVKELQHGASEAEVMKYAFGLGDTELNEREVS